MPIPRIRCPNPKCQRELWDEKSPHTPEAGLLNVCVYCLQVMRFTSATEVRPITTRELANDERVFLMPRLFIAKRFCINCQRPMPACIEAGECGRVKPPSEFQ